MSWNLIRNYADSVVHGGAKLFQNGNRHIQSFQKTVMRLETLAVSSRGNDRVIVLRRWLKSLKDAEAYTRDLAFNEVRQNETDENKEQTMVFYQDVDTKDEPVTFHVVFLHSEALEGITLSMIREEPNDEEVALVLEIFGYCLLGGEEEHYATLTSIKDLAAVFSCYSEELLMKREELLQFAQSSITGLKISAEQVRIDAEITRLETEIMKEIMIPSCEAHHKSSEELDPARTQALQESLLQVRHYSKLKALLLQRKYLQHGDSPVIHAQKLDKLDILSRSLAHSASETRRRIDDHRHRGEEAMSYRLAKVNEVTQAEKDLVDEIARQQQRKDELEAELKKVNRSLATASLRLSCVREEKQHFKRASNDILRHFQCREQEMLRSIALGETEAEVTSSWITFIESSWKLQCDSTRKNEEFTKAELGRFAQRFESILAQVLPHFKDDLLLSVRKYKDVVHKLHEMSENVSLRSNKKRVKLEAQYHDMEEKVQFALSVVENIKQLLSQSEELYWDHDENVVKLIDELQKVKHEFEYIERPYLGVSTPTTTRWRKLTKKLASKETRERVDLLELYEPVKQKEELNKEKDNEEAPPVIDGQDLLDSDDEMAGFESELITVIRDHTVQELDDWEV